MSRSKISLTRRFAHLQRAVSWLFLEIGNTAGRRLLKRKRPSRTHDTLLQRAETAQRPSRKKMSVVFDADAKVRRGNELRWTLLSSWTGKNKCPQAGFISISWPESTCDKGNLYVFRLPLRPRVIISSPNLPGRHRYVPAGFTCTRVCSENLRRGFCQEEVYC